MSSENIEATYAWLKEQGFMIKTDEDKVREQGLIDGANAGSWVIDGNTCDDVCHEILRQMADGDPALALPELRLGEWADDPSFGEILELACVEIDEDADDACEIEDDLFCTYSDAWYEGMQREVERACLARMPEVQS